MYDWYDHPMNSRAPANGDVGVDGKPYKGGEFEPLYVPRPEMPQVDLVDYPKLFEFLKQRGVAVKHHILSPEALKAHQRVDWDRHHKPMSLAELTRPILVSEDFYIIDGHHRWYEHKVLDQKVHAFIVEAEFEEAVKAVFAFPKTYTVNGKQ